MNISRYTTLLARVTPGWCLPRAVALSAVGLTIVLGCAPNVYKMWDLQIREMHEVDPLKGLWHTKDDISLLLGGEPTKWETVETTTARAGLGVLDEQPIVSLVITGSRPDIAGLRVGEMIVSINGKHAADSGVVMRVVRQRAKRNETIVLETDSGTHTIIPRVPVTEQCYWHISGGPVSRTGAYGGWA
jgi:hypothetical protein